MKHKSLIAFLIIVSLLSGGHILGLRLAGQGGAYLAQGYMLIPAIAGVTVAGGWGLLFPQLAVVSGGALSKALAVFLTYALFVGFGEEILYRGYFQSRLNEAFGCPYVFFGVRLGWGLVIAAFLFGLTHVGILLWMLGVSSEVTWAWGVWTFFGGLVFGFVREKSGGVLASALLHGLPQAIASAVMLFIPS